MRSFDAGEEVLFEARARGYPPASAAPATYALVLLVAFWFTLMGGSITFNFASASWRVPVLVPVFAAIGAVELYRLALWRSATWLVTATRVLRVRGVFRSRVEAITRSDDTHVAFELHPPAVIVGERRLELDGLDREDALALDRFLRSTREPEPIARARGTVARERRRWPKLVAILLAAVLAESNAVVQRRRGDEFGALVPVLKQAMMAASALSRPDVHRRWDERVAADTSLTAEDRKWLGDNARFAFHGSDAGSAMQSSGTFVFFAGELELENRISAPSTREGIGRYPITEEERLVVRLRCASGPSIFPSSPRVEVLVTEAPDEDVFLDHLKAQLDARGIAYTITREPR